MVHKFLTTVLLFICMAFAEKAVSQNVVIDYQAWNPSNPPCNLFGSATNVPATLNGNAGTLQHQTMVGQPTYNTSGKDIELVSTYVNASSILGTRYRIAYNFKVGYSYAIYVTAAADVNTVGYSTGPYLRMDIDNSGGGGGTACNGAQTIVQNLSGNPPPIQLSTTNFTEYQFSAPALSSAYSTLEVSAIPAIDGGTKTIRIQKIRIVETAPTPTFTLSPDSLNISCGSGVAQNFTVTNVYNSPGVTSYEWNLSSSSNGWQYNGSPAPQNISTTTNTITLTPGVNATTLSNVAVTVKINNVAYQVDTCIVTKTNYSGQIMPITQLWLCSGQSVPFNLSSSLGNDTATWSISPSGAAIIQNLAPNGQAALITGASTTTDISATVTAAISNGCGLVYTSLTIIPNTPLPYTCTDVGDSVCVKYICAPAPGYSIQLAIPNPHLANTASWHWQIINGYFQGNVTDMYVPWNMASYNIVYPNMNEICTVMVRPVNSCGLESSGEPFKWMISPSFCTPGYSLFKVSPNPASTTVRISPDESSMKMAAKSSVQVSFAEIEILDKMGNIQKQLKYGRGTRSTDIDISSLPTDTYIIRIFNGNNWEEHKIIIVR